MFRSRHEAPRRQDRHVRGRGAAAPLAMVLVVAVVASCLPGKAPKVSAGRTLELGAGEPGGASASAATKPFAVAFGGPKGETDDPSEITIVFNRPMRPLELASDTAETAPPATVAIDGVAGASAPRGAWRWMGTSALVFAPETRLPRATGFTVTVPAGTRALDGSALADAYTFAFTTPGPKLVGSTPDAGEDHVEPTAAFDLRFNQPVDPKEVERATRLLVGDAKAPRAVRFAASWPKSDVKTVVRLTPAARLPLDARVEVAVDATLRGLEGPRPAGIKASIATHTYGALVVHGFECATSTPRKKCAAHGYVALDLSNRVKYSDLEAHVRVEGAPAVAWGERDGGELVDYASLDVKLAPARAYTLVVTAGLRDKFGQVLAADARLPLQTDDEWPAVQIGVEGTTFEAPAATPGRAREIPIGAVNVPSYELVAAALSEAAVTDLVVNARGGSRERFDDAKRIAGGRSEVVAPAGAKNATAVRTVRLDALLAGGPTPGHGAVVIAAKEETIATRPYADTRIVAVTDLAISAKMSRFGSVVWVTRLSDGRPAAGASVVVRGAEGERFATKTDGDGIAVIPAEKYVPIDPSGSGDPRTVLVARLGNDWTWRRVSDVLSTWQYAPSSDPSGRLTPRGMLFTDRGIYKTGETVRVKGLFRTPLPKGTATPVGREVSVQAFDSNETKLAEQKVKLGAFGQLAVDVAIPGTAHLGTLEIRAEMEGADAEARGTTSTTVQLATYRPAEFKVGVETDRPSYVRGDKATFVARGDYLFGAPMTGGKVRFTATRGPGYFAPPGTDGLTLDDDAFTWGQPDASPRAGELQSGAGALGDKGRFEGALALALPTMHGAEVVSIEAEVEDVSRQTIAGRTSAIVHPGEFYVGMKPAAQTFVPKGQALRPELAAIEPSGKRRAGVPVHVELVKRTWHSVMEASGEQGHYASRTVDATVASCDTTTTATVASCDLTPAEPGYFLVRASTKDPRGNPVAASTGLYVLGDGEWIGWATSDGSKLELVTDKKAYEIGDVATVLVKSPFREAEALVTVERAGVYTQQRLTLRGAMPTVSIPVTDALRPNAFVSIHLVRGRTQAAPSDGPDVGAPAFRLGYAEITVNPEARRLKVAITPSRKEFQPGEEVVADVAVTDRAGKGARGEVTFYAVDEGVLMLTGYKTPDPIPVFTAPRPLAVVSMDSREDLARALLTINTIGADKGGDGGGGGGMREDFRSTAYFQPSLVTDAGGKAQVRFKLPDSLTTYRLMAVVAAEDDRFGFGESQIVASRKLMARPNLPRFMRAGDTMEAGVVVSSKGLPATRVEISLEASGVTLTGDATQTIALPANGSMEVRWPIATPAVGSAKLAFHVRGGDAKDDVQVVRDVEAPLSPEAVALYGETGDAAAEKLGDLSAMRRDVGGLDVRLSSTALVGLDDGVEQLIQYPYGCTEQLTSRLVPLVPLRALAADYHIALPADLAPVIEKTVAKILQNQHGDGGFGWWPDARRSEVWISAYALWALDIVKKGGTLVPDDAIAEATRYLRGALEGALRRGDVERAEAAFMVDVLASVGSPDTGYASRLFDERAKLPLFARALLAHAMVVSKMDVTQARELTRDVEAHLRVTPTGAIVTENVGDAYAVLLDSEARTTAMVIRALVAVDPGHPLAARLAKGLLGAREGGRWRSTQETAWALLALDDYRRAQEKAAPSFDATVFLGDARLFSVPFQDRSVASHTESFGAAKLFESNASRASLAFQVKGKGKLFYEARLRYARTDLPTTGIDRGFFVQKRVRSVRPEALRDALATMPDRTATSASGGDLVLVDLIVVTPEPREQVVIDDPLPAGLEAVQASLATTAQSLDVTDSGGEGDGDDEEASDDDARANDRAYGQAWYHREIKDDRVLTFVEHMPAGMYHYRYLARATTFGRFVVPPTRAECMYEPEIFGRTAASTFDVGHGK
jgi:uncharacterized protein YfaS (alpha-2-macroglobulin family)